MSTAEPQAVVFVIDDDPDVRAGLDNLFRSVGLRVETFASPSEFLKIERPDVPSCVVLDIRFTGGEQSGLEFQRDLISVNTQIPIVFITGHGDIRMSVQAMRLGATEFLTKPFRDQELLDAVRNGIDKDRRRRSDEQAIAAYRQRFDSLTAREREIFALVATGRMNKQIAAEIGVSEVTVKIHRGSVMRKMRARSLADLVRISDKLNLSLPAFAPRP
ncbi:MAG TPA: response regulator [Xanthobacteraceae bacterium]|nr:response regulator [Xanthobacteraceae bacterium]